MNHEHTSIKKCEKNESNGDKKTTRVKATGKDHGGKEGRKGPHDDKQTKSENKVCNIYSRLYGCCELLFLFGPHCPAQHTQPQSH
jgi:hypothetical protein